MAGFNQLFFTVYTYYKKSYKRKASRIAVFYISLLQISLVLLLGMFFAAFFNQMKIDTLTSGNAWILFVITSIFIYFKNWMSFSGRNRMILKAKMTKKKTPQQNIILIWLLPVASTALAIILLRSFL
ncbi:MAG: hypothetical protein DRI75_01835 [Bacteroidetes bacterium]|nr:MAG: hypothetical protein DRI75_01835 [Bacteroidota bacterium]